jgi:hypothetical protein
MLFRRVKQRERNLRSIHHLWFFSRRTLRELLLQAGFASVQVRDSYLSPATGLRAAGSHLTRAAGRLAYGGPLIRATGSPGFFGSYAETIIVRSVSAIAVRSASVIGNSLGPAHAPSNDAAATKRSTRGTVVIVLIG